MATQKQDSEVWKLQKEVEYLSKLIDSHKDQKRNQNKLHSGRHRYDYGSHNVSSSTFHSQHISGNPSKIYTSDKTWTRKQALATSGSLKSSGHDLPKQMATHKVSTGMQLVRRKPGAGGCSHGNQKQSPNLAVKQHVVTPDSKLPVPLVQGSDLSLKQKSCDIKSTVMVLRKTKNDGARGPKRPDTDLLVKTKPVSRLTSSGVQSIPAAASRHSVPSARKVVPSSGKVVSSGRKVVPSATKVVPSTTKVVLSATKVVPSVRKVVLPDKKVVPSVRKVVLPDNKVVQSDRNVVVTPSTIAQNLNPAADKPQVKGHSDSSKKLDVVMGSVSPKKGPVSCHNDVKVLSSRTVLPPKTTAHSSEVLGDEGGKSSPYKWTKSCGSSVSKISSQESSVISVSPYKVVKQSRTVLHPKTREDATSVRRKVLFPGFAQTNEGSPRFHSAGNTQLLGAQQILETRYKVRKSPIKKSIASRNERDGRTAVKPGIKHGARSSGRVPLAANLQKKGRFKLIKNSSGPAAPPSNHKTSRTAVAPEKSRHLVWQRKFPTVHNTVAQTSSSLKAISRYKLVKKAIQYSTRIQQKKNSAAVSTDRHQKPGRTSRRGRPGQKAGHRDSKEWIKKYSLKRDNSEAGSTIKPMSVNQVLGRKVLNASRNKFKFIRPKDRILSRFKIDKSRKRVTSTRLRSHRLESSSLRKGHMINISGALYRTSRCQLKLVKSQTDKRRNNPFIVRRQTPAVNNVTVHRILDRAYKVERKREIASRAVQKSIQTAHLARYKKVNRRRQPQTYCLYYNRFGRCNRGNKCKHLHDPDRIAVCTRFLRGRCDITGCPFSHKVAKEKMPVCQYFLRGICDRDNCPYLHSNVNKDAEICQDFIQGYCALGDKCQKKHSFICPDYKRDGECPRGRKCQLKHVKKSIRKRKNSLKEGKIESSPAKRTRQEVTSPAEDDDDITLPMKDRTLPSFIAIDTDSSSSDMDSSPLPHYMGGSALHIRPRLSHSGITSD